MFGIFDPPTVKVRKHSPASVYPMLDQIQIAVQRRLSSELLSPTDHAQIVGFVLIAWVLNEHRQGRIDLSNYSGRFMSNLGANILRSLRSKSAFALAIEQEFEADGTIDLS